MGGIVVLIPALLSGGSVLAGFSTFFGITGVLGAIGAFASTLILGVASRALAPKQKFASVNTGITLQTYSDPIFPRSVIYGKFATGGSLVYWEALGTDNSDLWMVIAWADSPCDSITTHWVDGVATSFSSNNAVGQYNNKLYCYDHLGAESQTVDSTLDAASTNWTSNHRGRGICYSVFKLIWDQSVWTNGKPQMLAEIKGRSLYDPRLDSTQAGGSGSQRSDDSTTWTWSDNAALALLDYLKGVYINGHLIAGPGIPIGYIDVASFMTAATICDQAVSLKGGGSEARYTVNGIITTDHSHQEVVQGMLDAMSGTLIAENGKMTLYAGAALSTDAELTDDDLAGPITISQTKSLQEKVNAIFATFPDPNQKYESVSAPPLTSAAYEAEDADQQLPLTADYPFTVTHTRVQRLNKIRLGHEREQLSFEGSFKLKALDDAFAVWKTFYLTSEVLGYSSQKMRVTGRTIESDGSISLRARSEDDTKYDWTAAIDEQDPVTANTTTPLNNTTVTAPGSSDIAVTAVMLADSKGQHPAITVAVTTTSASSLVTSVEIEFKTNAGSTWYFGGRVHPSSANCVIQGVQPGTLYDVRARYVNKFGVVSSWTTKASAATTGEIRILSQDSVPMANTGGGITARNPDNPLTATDAGSTASIAIAAFTQYFDFGSVSYNSGSITGKSFSTKYYVYADDANYSGGAVTYAATTTYTAAIAPGRNFVGYITTPADGAGGTSGTGGCVAADQLLPNGKKAEDLIAGDRLLAIDVDGELHERVVIKIDSFEEEAIELVTEGGAVLMCSPDTPVPVFGGDEPLEHCALAANFRGQPVAVMRDGTIVPERVTAIRSVGPRKLIKVDAGGAVFAAGAAGSSGYVFSHNKLLP